LPGRIRAREARHRRRQRQGVAPTADVNPLLVDWLERLSPLTTAGRRRVEKDDRGAVLLE